MLPSFCLNILFLDIETVAMKASYHELDENFKNLWARKAVYLRKHAEDTDEKLFNSRAGIYAEFGKVVVIGVGKFDYGKDNRLQFRQRTFSGYDEKVLLQDFQGFLKSEEILGLQLCAHNGKEFDFPYLSRRMIVHGIPLPASLDYAGKKPWEVPHLDTMELWKFGDYKHLTSLNLLAHILGVPGSKTDMDGSMVNPVFYSPDGLERISNYCAADVFTLAGIFLRMKGYCPQEMNVIPWD
jgi:uncharacterized protein YprB with RNaseH-like and TPR domain